MSPEGKPVQVNANVLNAARAQSVTGMTIFKMMSKVQYHFRIANKQG